MAQADTTGDQADSMRGNVCLVTGGTTGIGRYTALALAKMGARVVIIARNPALLDTTVQAMRAESGNDAVEGLVADLSSQAEIRRVAAEFQARHDRLHALVNNAGGVFSPRRETVDGIEYTFALDHLAYFLLTNLLLDTLKASAPARVVSVSSSAHQMGRINFDDLQGKRRYTSFGAYSQAKLANLLFAYELARRLEGTGVTSNALHPGVVASNFGTSGGPVGNLFQVVTRPFGISPEQGAQTPIYLASSPQVEGVTGLYFFKCKPVNSSPASHDVAAQQRLWAISEQMTGLAQ